MDRRKRMRIADVSNKDLFGLLEGHVKDTISREISDIFEKESNLVDAEYPWVFQLRK